MPKKNLTAAEKRRFGKIADIPCPIPVKRKDGSITPCGSAVIIHHKTGAGMGRKSSNYDVMGICPIHHTDGGEGVAIHAGVETWEKLYGTQNYWIEWTQDQIF